MHVANVINKYRNERQNQQWAHRPRALAASAKCVGRAGVIHTDELRSYIHTL